MPLYIYRPLLSPLAECALGLTTDRLPQAVHGFETELDADERSGLRCISYQITTGCRCTLTLAGKARAIAGPKPFQRAVTPSAAMSFRAQSTKPVYVPDGALCSRDLIV